MLSLRYHLQHHRVDSTVVGEPLSWGVAHAGDGLLTTQAIIERQGQEPLTTEPVEVFIN